MLALDIYYIIIFVMFTTLSIVYLLKCFAPARC